MVPYKPPFYSTRKLFHVFLLLFSLFQAVSYITYIEGLTNYVKWSYSCHLIGIFCEIAAISLVSILWSKTLMSRNNAKKCVIPVLVFVDLVFLFYVIYIIINMAYYKDSFLDYYFESYVIKEILVAEPLILAINGFCLVYLGIRIAQRLVSHPSWSGMAKSEKSSIMFRLIGTMVVCCLSFLLRAGMEIALYINGAEGVSTDVWVIFSTWVPTIMPSYVLMYTMRKADIRIKSKKSSRMNQNQHSANLTPLVFGNQDNSYFDETKDNGASNYDEDIGGDEDDMDEQLRLSNLDFNDSNDNDFRVASEPLIATQISGGSQHRSGNNSAINIIINNNNNNNNNSNNQGNLDFFKGAPDLRPSFYRTNSNTNNSE